MINIPYIKHGLLEKLNIQIGDFAMKPTVDGFFTAMFDCKRAYGSPKNIHKNNFWDNVKL